MTAPQRVVQRVRLRAPSESLVRRGATLLEDALRTAASPLAGRVLVVRSLSVGSIRVGCSAAVISASVEERLREVATSAVHAGAPGAGSAAAVYFRQEAEPLLLLAIRIAGGASADEWFWPIAVPQWHRWMSRDDALRVIAYAASADRAAPATLAAIVGELSTRGTVDVLLTAVRHSDAAPLMRGCPSSDFPRAIPAHVILARLRASPPARTSDLTAATEHVLERWLVRWGPSDARTAWLAAMLLVAERPALAGASDLADRVRRVIIATACERRSVVVRSGDLATAAPSATSDARANVDSARVPEAQSLSTAISRSSTEPPSTARAVSAHHSDERPTSRPTPLDDELAETDAPVAATEPDVTRGHDVDGMRDTASRANHSDAPVERSRDAERGVTGGGDIDVGAVARDAQSQPPRASDGISSKRADAPSAPARVGPRFSDGDLESAHAGLFLLIPAMMRLGMGSFLETQPELLAGDFPMRVLGQLARRLVIPPTDAVWQVLEPATGDFAPAAWRGDFVVPDLWRDLVAARGPWVIRRAGNARVLTDGSWELVLARWHDRLHAGAKALARGIEVRAGAPVEESAVDLVLGSWCAAIRRYCRRAAGLGLRAIVTRPGRIAVARTHLDVVFSTRAVDVRIRRAGLDMNPQWLPWLGRVVQFHYAPEGWERADG